MICGTIHFILGLHWQNGTIRNSSFYLGLIYLIWFIRLVGHAWFAYFLTRLAVQLHISPSLLAYFGSLSSSSPSNMLDALVGHNTPWSIWLVGFVLSTWLSSSQWSTLPVWIAWCCYLLIWFTCPMQSPKPNWYDWSFWSISTHLVMVHLAFLIPLVPFQSVLLSFLFDLSSSLNLHNLSSCFG